MGAYIVRRLLQMIPVVILVTMGIFMLLLLTGDPIQAMLGQNTQTLDEEQVASLRHDLRLDRPLPMQYVLWLNDAMHGNLGRSTYSQRPVFDEIMARLPVTVQLGLAAWLLSVLIGIPAGIISATRRGSKKDVVAAVLTMGGMAIPDFWLGMMLILVLGVTLNWLPTFGFTGLFPDPVQGIRHLILPAFALGLMAAAVNMRQMRSAMLEVLGLDYVRTARAKGLTERRVVWAHSLKNALLPVVTIMGMQVGRLFGGAVVIETLFAIPGMGRLMVNSILMRDFPMVQGIVLVTAFAVVLANLATDLVYGYLDPRIRYTRRETS